MIGWSIAAGKLAPAAAIAKRPAAAACDKGVKDAKDAAEDEDDHSEGEEDDAEGEEEDDEQEGDDDDDGDGTAEAAEDPAEEAAKPTTKAETTGVMRKPAGAHDRKRLLEEALKDLEEQEAKKRKAEDESTGKGEDAVAAGEPDSKSDIKQASEIDKTIILQESPTPTRPPSSPPAAPKAAAVPAAPQAAAVPTAPKAAAPASQARPDIPFDAWDRF